MLIPTPSDLLTHAHIAWLQLTYDPLSSIGWAVFYATLLGVVIGAVLRDEPRPKPKAVHKSLKQKRMEKMR